MNQKYFRLTRLLIVLVLTITPISVAIANDDTNPDGASLHQKNCAGCHDNMNSGDGTSMYTRNDRKVTAFLSLEPMVRRCDANVGLNLLDDQIIALRNFLNNSFYKYSAQQLQQQNDTY